MCIECVSMIQMHGNWLVVTGTMDWIMTFQYFPIINWDIMVFLMGYNGI